MSPQIVTETLYSLALHKTDPFIPTAIHLITTQSGAKEARLQLLHRQTGKFYALCRDYQLPAIEFPETHIHIIEDYQSKRLDDIKTPEQNEAAADFITAIVSELTRDDATALHVSIAGGRKTMGYYLGYALSLYGRTQDRLSHVLVTDRYEGLRDFFYPTPHSHVIIDKDGRSLDAQEAEVMLAEIPFVRLRGGIPQHLLEGKSGFSESIKFARQIETEPHLKINIPQRCLWVEDIKIVLSEVNYIFYLWLLERSVDGRPAKRMPSDNNKHYAEEFLACYDRYSVEIKDNDRTRSVLEQGMPNQWMSERITGIKNSFTEALGEHAARPFIVQKSGKNNSLQYQIALSEEQLIYIKP